MHKAGLALLVGGLLVSASAYGQEVVKIGEIEAWAINPQEFQTAIGAGSRWFYLLILDDKGHVWASKFRSDRLPEMDPLVRARIEAEISRAKGKTARGVFPLIQKSQI